MSGPAPKMQRRRRNPPARGEWQPTAGIGWQHGPIPEPPDGLLASSRAAWDTWFRAWFASHWTPDDLPGLRKVVLFYDATERGTPKANDMTALVRLLDTYGITPAGQAARRWAPPKAEPAEPSAKSERASRYAHLRAVS